MDELNDVFKKFIGRIIGEDLKDEVFEISPEKIGGERFLAKTDRIVFSIPFLQKIPFHFSCLNHIDFKIVNY